MPFSDTWRTITLGECVTTKKGFAFKSGWYTDDGHPLVKVSDFTSDSVDASALTRIQPEQANNYTQYSLRTGDVVVQTVGSWPSNPQSVVGKAIRVPISVNGALLNQNAVRLNPVAFLDRGFLFYLLRGEHFKSFIIGTAQGAASQAAITLDSLRAYEFSIPPITTQRKIAAILSAYDDLIENNMRRIAILEEMAQSLYREWFVNFRFPGHEQVNFVDSPLGKIPEGWKCRTLGSILDFHIGGGWGQEAENDEFSNPAYVIRGTDIPDARALHITNCPLRFHTNSNIRSRKLQPNDLVFEVSGGSKGQPVGRCVFVSKLLLKQFDEDVICASFCKLIRTNMEILTPEILYHYLLESYTNLNFRTFSRRSKHSAKWPG